MEFTVVRSFILASVLLWGLCSPAAVHARQIDDDGGTLAFTLDSASPKEARLSAVVPGVSSRSASGESLTSGGRTLAREVYAEVAHSLGGESFELGVIGFVDLGQDSSVGLNLKGRRHSDFVELRLDLYSSFSSEELGYDGSFSLGHEWKLGARQALSVTGRISAGAPRLHFQDIEVNGCILLMYRHGRGTFGLSGETPIDAPVAPYVGLWTAFSFS